jgi:hypothetical protein
MPADADHRDDRAPLIRVVRGTPTPEELAALVGVLAARWRPAPGAPPDAGPSPWMSLARPGAITGSGLPARPGAAAWRHSALPR